MKNLKLTGGIIWVLELLYDTKPLQHKLRQLRQLENGTIGKSIADLLKLHTNKKFIPGTTYVDLG